MNSSVADHVSYRLRAFRQAHATAIIVAVRSQSAVRGKRYRRTPSSPRPPWLPRVYFSIEPVCADDSGGQCDGIPAAER